MAAESARYAALLGRNDEVFRAFASCRSDEIIGDDGFGLKNAERRLRMLLGKLDGAPPDALWKTQGEQRARTELVWNLQDQAMLEGSKEVLDMSLRVPAQLPDRGYNYHRPPGLAGPQPGRSDGGRGRLPKSASNRRYRGGGLSPRPRS